MEAGTRRRGLYVGGLVVLVVLAAALLLLVVPQDRTPLGQGTRALPTDVVRSTFTDWAQVREEADGAGLVGEDRVAPLEEFAERAYDLGLTIGSPLAESLVGMARTFGFTPADAAWELYGQSREGAVDVLRLLTVDYADVAAGLEAAGYVQEEDPRVWTATPEVVAGLEVPLTPLHQTVALVEEEDLVLLADSLESLAPALAVVDGEMDSLADVEGVDQLVEVAGEASVATLWVGDFACEDLAMSTADEADQAEADRLVAAAGGVHPLTGLVMAQQADGAVEVGLLFEDDARAEDDLQPRTDLAAGPAPGQGGAFTDRFTVADAVTDGALVHLTLTPVDGPFLSDVGEGPVLFATC